VHLNSSDRSRSLLTWSKKTPPDLLYRVDFGFLRDPNHLSHSGEATGRRLANA